MQFAVSIGYKYESLLVEELEQEPKYEIEKKIMRSSKKSLHHARDEVIPKKEKKNIKPWMTIDILNLMETCKMCKRENFINIYKEINNIKRECAIVKENWYNGKCKESEKLRKANNSRKLHKQVKEITGCKKSHQGTGYIKSRDGNILFEQEEI